MSAIEAEGLVSPSDIAEMARVSRGAVSNWRRRIKDFPEPIAGTESKPLFSRREVRNWLADRGVEATRDTGAAAVWASMNLLRGHLEAFEATVLILTLCAARKALNDAGAAEWDRLTRLAETNAHTALAQIDQLLTSRGIVTESSLASNPRLTSETSKTIGQVMAKIGDIKADNLASTADFTLDRLERSQMRVAGEHGLVNSRVSILLASLASGMDGGTLYDPACGLAVALIAAVEEEGAQPDRIVGHDVSESAIKLASMRSFLYGALIDFATTNVVMYDIEPELRADVIIAEPPFGVRASDHVALNDIRFEFGPIPRNSSEMLWIQHVVHHLCHLGRGYVITPQGPLFRGGPEAKIRNELLQNRCIEAIVALPGKMLPYTSIPLALWVLSPARSECVGESVLLINATEVEAPEQLVASWLRAEQLPKEVAHSRVAVSELLAANAELMPSRWVERRTPSNATVTRARREAERALTDALTKLEATGRNFDLTLEVPAARILSVQELADLDVLSIRAGKKFDSEAPMYGERVISVSQVNRGELPAGQGTVPEDATAWLTAPGDVLVTTMNRVQTLVDLEGGHLPLPGIYRLRIGSEDILLPDYLAMVLEGTWNERFVSGAVIRRASLKDLEVPMVPLDDQRRVINAVAGVRAVREAAKAVKESSNTAIEALLETARYQKSGK